MAHITKMQSVQIRTAFANGEKPEAIAQRFNITVERAKGFCPPEPKKPVKKTKKKTTVDPLS